MAIINWTPATDPVLTDTWSNFLADLNERDLHIRTMDYVTPVDTNIATGTIQLVEDAAWPDAKFQRWSGTAWADVTVSVAGGGTAGTTFGTMGVQNANNIAVTGGSLTGVAVSALTSFSVGSHMIPSVSATYDLCNITTYAGMRNVIVKTGMMIPVGANMWIT